MKNLMSRDEYLHNMEEGFIKDTLKKGWEKVKSFFKIGMKKIKNFITIFDSDGNVLPVVTPQAVIDKFANSNAVKVYASQNLVDSVIAAGGKGCETTATVEDTDEIYDYGGPSGKEYAKWIADEKYKETIEYKNFLKLSSALNESIKRDNSNIIEESWEGVVRDRNKYTIAAGADGKDAFGGEMWELTTEEFKDVLRKAIKERITLGGKLASRDNDNRKVVPVQNILIWGAPGIGKSTIPKMIVKEYNEKVAKNDPNEMISLINVNCANLHPGDLLMPTPPKAVQVLQDVGDFEDVEFEKMTLSDNEREKYKKIINNSQAKATDAPKSWLPSFKEVGGVADNILDTFANKGVYKDEEGNSVVTRCGGIILLDELLRTDADVMGEMMNLLIERRLYDWNIGSKWVIIACSNRPCDDSQVQDTFKEWNSSPAKKARFPEQYMLIPNPEDWKAWIKDKGCDDLILDFIFDKNSKVGNEYPRWHSDVRNAAEDSQQNIVVEPRQWFWIINAINAYVIEHNYPNILTMTREELKSVLRGKMDKSFCEEFLNYFDDHRMTINIDNIIADPHFVAFKKNDERLKSPSAAMGVIDSLVIEMEDKFSGENRKKLTDNAFANIIAWVGINYPGDLEIMNRFMHGVQTNLFKDGDSQSSKTENILMQNIKSMMTLEAAFPCNNYIDSDGNRITFEDTINYYINRKAYPWPKDSMEQIKEMMKKYFPWRIKGDKIRYYDDVVLEDDDTESETPKKPSKKSK